MPRLFKHFGNERRVLFSTLVNNPRTLVEKIVSRRIVKGNVGPLQFVQISPDICMTHDNTAAVMNKFHSMKLREIHDPKQLVFTVYSKYDYIYNPLSYFCI